MAKVLISFLGTGSIDENNIKPHQYRPAYYQFGTEKPIDTTFFAAAMMKHYNIDKVLLIGTTGSMWGEVYSYFAEKNNSVDGAKWEEICNNCEKATKDSELEVPHKADIEQAIGKGSKIILLRYGLNETELQENIVTFLSLENELQNGDELYVDVTHSFRSLPLYMMNLLLYMKSVSNKKVTIKNISYGMFEAKEKGRVIENGETQEKEITPVVDLTGINTMTDYIMGAYAFQEYGNAYKIADLLKQECVANKNIANRLTDFSDAMNLGYLTSIKNQVRKLDSMKEEKLSPLPKVVLPKVIGKFTKTNAFVLNDSTDNDPVFQYNMAKWHYDHKNYMASYLILYVAILSYVLENSIYGDCYKDDSVEREDYAKIILGNKYNADPTKFPAHCVREEQKKVDDILCKLSKKIQKARNELAHCSDTAKKSNQDYIKDLSQYLNDLAPYFKAQPVPQPKQQQTHITKLINCSNHHSSLWSEQQRKAAEKQYGEIKDLTFPKVSPQATKNDIRALACNTLKQITDIAGPQEAVVHIMGEMTLTFTLVSMLQEAGYTCVASTTERIIPPTEIGKKEAEYQFVNFRTY